MSGEIVPFGKYKGQPLDVLANDREYCDWLASQDWFRSRFSSLYTVVINNFSEPSETPEHNKLQAMFLSEDFRKTIYERFVSTVKEEFPSRFHEAYYHHDGYKEEPEFESFGVDVQFGGLTYIGNVSTKCIRAELKPTMGDDYPAVLRQIRANRSNLVLVGKYTGQGASIDQVRKMFASVPAILMMLDEVL